MSASMNQNSQPFLKALLRAFTSTQRSPVTLGAVLLCIVALAPVMYLAVSPQKHTRDSYCPCEEAQKARKELADYRANLTREEADALAAGGGAVSVGPLQRTVRRQRTLIEEQAQEIHTLREAARAREQLRLSQSPDAVAPKEYRKFIVTEDDPRLWRQRTFRKHAAYGFIAFSAYRLSPTMITVTGIGALRDRGKRRMQSCHWVSHSGERTEGKLGITTFNEHHWYLYEFLLLNCSLPEPKAQAGQDSSSSSPFWTSQEGGHLEVHLDQEVWYPFVEEKGYKIMKPNSDGPFQYESLFCGPPMFGHLSPTATLQWVAYHRYYAGIEHFVLYDSGAFDENFRLAFKELMGDGVVTVTDFREALQYDVWAQNQALAMHDCLYRSRELSRWVWFHDLDEYVLAPPATPIPAVLRKYRDKAFVSHGAYEFSVDNCEAQDVMDQNLHGKYAVELLLTRWPKPICYQEGGDPMNCIDWFGMRKLILNPRKVQRVYIHHVDPVSIGGVDLPVTELWHNHYKRLVIWGRPCAKKAWKGDTRHDTGVADVAAKARACAAQGAMNEERCKPKVES